MKARIVLIGPGRVGAAVGKRLHQAGYPLVAVIGREQRRAEDAARFIGCDPAAATTDPAQARRGQVVLLALPDDQIGAMAARLQQDPGLPEQTTLVHFSGLQPASLMSVAGSACAAVSIHPLLPFADREMAAARLTDCPCAIEGDEAAVPLAEQLVGAIGAQGFRLPSDAKVLYHAAACIASNYLVTLTAAARDLLLHCGFDNQQALALLRPIQQATSDNLGRLDPESALTGPIVRGDSGTVESHIAALEAQVPQLLELYRCLGQQTLALATASGRLDKQPAVTLQRLLSSGASDDCAIG
jgi:predicted short-subunit dehydrogenase-like oxidoreductase (DUF2520 family)